MTAESGKEFLHTLAPGSSRKVSSHRYRTSPRSGSSDFSCALKSSLQSGAAFEDECVDLMGHGSVCSTVEATVVNVEVRQDKRSRWLRGSPDLRGRRNV